MVATVTVGMLAFSAMLFLLLCAVAAVLIPPEHLGAVLGRPAGVVEYARVVLLATVLGIVAGAVGSGLEASEVVRRVAYVHRRRERAQLADGAASRRRDGSSP